MCSSSSTDKFCGTRKYDDNNHRSKGNRVNEYWMKRDLTNVFVVYFRNNDKNTTYALLCNKSNPG